ncbi:nucleoprotein TPR-like [Stegodyphus dumicola]|uniref:nucleoprotein TPR-like n=1 Tax=Stegodyphus dumicola TaxID=202533 RepID=UPI0015AA0B86|nr:nucleoprotein TPR-like [Stegodyphus dumicola]
MRYDCQICGQIKKKYHKIVCNLHVIVFACNCNVCEQTLKRENKSVEATKRQQFQYEKEVTAVQRQLQESTDSCTKLKLQISEFEEILNSIQKELRDLQKLHDSSQLEFQASKRDNELLKKEKQNLTEQLEKRRDEIEKLNEDVKNLIAQATKANEEKFEAIAAAEEAKMKESSLQHQVNRLEQEREMLSNQIADLNVELTEKNHEIHTLKREKSNNILDLKARLEDRADEIQLLQKRLDYLKELVEEKDARIEALAEKIRQFNQSHSQAEEQFNLELNAQAKLIDLHKKASEDNQQRVEELMRAFEEAQKLLRESNESCDEMEKHCQVVENKCKEELEAKQKEIFQLKEELRKAKDAAHGFSQDALENMFPVAAATSKVLHSGMTLTELYVEFTRVQEELQQQKNENAKLTQELKHIIAEIEEKTPIINQRMLEYEKSKETITCLRSQLASALADYEKMLEERNDAKRISNSLERENSRLKSQVLDLNRQVQVLLKEIEEARGRTILEHRDNDKSHEEEEEEVTSTDDITADKVISRHLVTFKDIVEIQRKNQQLLMVIRDLSKQHEEMEKKLSSDISMKFEKDIATLSSQLEDLQKKRAKQSEMLETIVRQRDMYRVLLTSQGFSESLLGQPEGSLSFLQNNSSPFSPGDSRLKETKSAMNQLQAEFTNYKKEKAQNEKMLNEQLDNMRNEVSDLRVQNAKLASQIEYSEERVKILQSNLETYKKEYASFKDKNRQHSSMIIQHQQTINSLRQDLMLAQEKVAKSEVTISNLKAECELLRNAEQRLLQEKESAVREQQHQSRMMSNLQAVQNNLERIESETKRNLQYQIEKCEKENSILKTKLDNANEDYRNAVKVWEKLNKDLQAKVDAEVERNRKLHEDLVDAYSQVHALNQELLNVKSQLTTAPEKSSNETSKTPQKSVSAQTQAAAEVKLLKEQLNEAQMKIKALQDKLDLTTKSSEQYSNMCNDLELRLKEQDAINKQLKESMDSALLSNNEARNALEKSLEDMEKSNRELIEENMKLTQNSNSQLNELQKKVTDLLRLMDDYKNQAEVAKKTEEQARNDCQNQIKLMQEVQEKYERELMLHAQDIKVLSALKEEHQKCTSEIEKHSEAAKRAEQALSESKESWLRQEEIFQREIEALKTKISDLEECNHNLHDQLELMGTQMAALQSKNWDETPYASIQTDLKDTQHLLQVIQFIKKEKEIASTQFDVAQSENVRLSLKVEQLTSELNDAKAELKEMMNNTQAKAASDAQHSELLKKIEMMNLLSESNNLLRMEKESLSEAKMKLEEQLHELQEKFQPLSEKEKEMTQQIDMLTAENAALRVEVKSWQSRTNQLLEQSHRIGPQEYKNMMREIEELKAQKGRLAEELQRKQAEVSQIASNLSSVVKELENSRIELKEKSQEVVKMNEDNVEHQKTLLQIKKIGRKYKTQYDELKVNYDTLMAKVKSSDQANQEQAAQEMQKKLEESERIIKELKEEIEKQKESVNQANKTAETVQSKANEKEEKAKKLLAQFRHKYSQLNTEKESLVSEKNNLMKKVEELNSLVSTLMSSQEENLQSKSQAEAKIARLEKELRMAKDLRISERDYLQKQYDELYQKVSQQQKQTAKSTMVLGDRSSGSGTEPLTANIKPLTSPSTSGTSSSLRHSPHPHAASNINRPTPTASIRPMAIGTASSTPPTQARMAAVLPTTATPPHSEEDSVSVVAPTVPVTVPHAAVQPTPATATVAPTTVAATVSPVISEVVPTVVAVIEGREDSQVDSLHGAHVTGGPVASIPAAAVVVLPRIEESETSTEQAPVDSPAPTTSVIVSPPATQTQVVTPTIKRQREESISPNESQETSHKRVRMVSEGSQTNQQMPIATTVATPTNVAVVSAAQIIPRNKAQSSPIAEIVQPTSAQNDTKETPLPVISAPEAPISTVVEEEPVAIPVTIEAEILDADEKDDQNIEWESQDDAKIDDEYEAEVMEEEPVVDEDLDEVEQMQETDVRSPDDEDMTEDQQDDAEEMAESTPAAQDIDIQMDADSSSLQTAPTEQCMAPPADPPTLGMPVRTEISPSTEAMVQSTSNVTMQRLPVPVVPSRLDRSTPISRQHLTPFTISGQGSNFEEGDDSIVPSTPTLYVPRRADGFAEAVSSPHVPQVRFLFSSSESSPTQQGLSQLASQGALGVDDTRMDLSQFDEGGGRTVPSTPLQVSPPTEATVPEVSESSLEVDVGIANNDFTIPVIKVDLVDETSNNAGTSQNSSKIEASEEASATTDGNEVKSEEDKTTQLDTQPSDASASSESKHEVPTSESQSAEESAKTDATPDSDQSNKDASSSQTSRRKPIVWRKKSDATSDSETSELVSAGTSSASSGLLPTPGRGRARVRRMRYPTAGGNYSRGRGTEAVWSASGRRGRTSTRRRSMY